MEPIEGAKKPYFDTLKTRSQKSRVYRDYQLIGLSIADILGDRAHKALYIKLAKEHDRDMLFNLAKSVAEKREVKKPGAYFMRLLTDFKKRP